MINHSFTNRVLCGKKRYELSNHLGNVLAVITDRRIQRCNVAGLMYYDAQVVQVSDFYPFGMGIKEREWRDSAFGYRFGFNGKEQDNEVSGSGNTIAFEARIYDSRLGRFFSTDPWEYRYAWQSTYVYFKNSPISTLDINGMGGGDETEAETTPVAHTVAEGETIDDIAKTYGLSYYAIAKNNMDLDNGNKGYFTNPDGFKNQHKDYWENGQGNLWRLEVGDVLVVGSEPKKIENNNSGNFTPNFNLSYSSVKTASQPTSSDVSSLVGIGLSLKKSLVTSKIASDFVNRQTIDEASLLIPKGKITEYFGKGLKWTGRGFAVLSAVNIQMQYNNGEVNGVQYTAEQASNAFGAISKQYGTAWLIGWELGRAVTKTETYQDFKFEFRGTILKEDGYVNPYTGEQVNLFLDRINNK